MSTVLNTVVGLFLVRALLPPEFGIIAYFLRLFGLARFIGNVGLGAKIIEDVSTAQVNRDLWAINKTVYSLGIIRTASVFVIVILSIFSFFFSQDSVYLWLALIAPIASFLDHTTAIAQGLRRRNLIMLTTVLQPLLYLVFLIAATLSSTLYPELVYGGLTLSFLLTLIVCLITLKQNILFPQRQFISFGYLKQSMSKLVSLFALGLFSQLALSMSTIILGQLGQFEQAAYFNAGFNLVLIPINISSIVITSVFYPEFVSFTKSGKKLEAATLLQNFIEWILLLLPLCIFGLMMYAGAVVSVLYPADYDATVAVMIILAPFVLFGIIQSLFSFALIALDKVKHAIRIQFLQTLIIISGTYVSLSLAASQVSAGLAVTYTASIIIVTLLMWISLRQLLPVPFAAKNILACSVLALLCVVVPHQLISLIPLNSLILSSFLGVLASLASYLFILVMIFKGHYPRLKSLLTCFSILLLTFTVSGISQASECDPEQEIKGVHLLLCTLDPSSGTSIYIYALKETTQSDSINDNILLFDANGDGTTQLIIRFDSTPSTVTANIFLDQNQDGNVEYVITNELFTVNEGTASIFLTETYPSVKVTAQDGWYLPNGELNWNVVIETDGPQVYDVDTSIVELHGIIKRVWQRDMVLDGIPDSVWEYRDDDLDGVPEYGLWRLLTAATSNRNAARTWLWVNYDRLKPEVSPHYLLWPYLFSSNTFRVEINSPDDVTIDKDFMLADTANPYIGKTYFETQLFFEINWQTAK
jgi:O-antigen/teichoic acid export membrane protein